MVSGPLTAFTTPRPMPSQASPPTSNPGSAPGFYIGVWGKKNKYEKKVEPSHNINIPPPPPQSNGNPLMAFIVSRSGVIRHCGKSPIQ